jgi:hypothetical protein
LYQQKQTNTEIMNLELTRNQKLVIIKSIDLSIEKLNKTIHRDIGNHQAVIDLNNLYTAKRRLYDSI